MGRIPVDPESGYGLSGTTQSLCCGGESTQLGVGLCMGRRQDLPWLLGCALHNDICGCCFLKLPRTGFGFICLVDLAVICGWYCRLACIMQPTMEALKSTMLPTSCVLCDLHSTLNSDGSLGLALRSCYVGQRLLMKLWRQQSASSRFLQVQTHTCFERYS